MRTTKVKRLWPVLALAPLFALAAILGVSLWHSGPTPTALTPPAAEAQDAAAVLGGSPRQPAGGTCPVDLVSTASNVQCITSGDTIDVVVFTTDGSAADNVAVFVTGVSGSNTGATTVNSSIQAAVSGNDRGKKGVGLFHQETIDFSARGVQVRGDAYKQTISVRRSWANDTGTDIGNVWMFIYTDVALAGARGYIPDSATDGDRIDNGGTDVVERVVQVKFTEGLNEANPNIITGLPGNATRPPMAVANDPREFPVDDDQVEIAVLPSSDDTATAPGIGGRIEVVTTFAAGSVLATGAANPLMDTQPEGEAMAPSYGDTSLSSIIEGWADEGAFRATVVITHIANDGTRTVFDPFYLYRGGPAASVEFAADGNTTPSVPHYVTATGDTYSGFGALKVTDAVGRDVSPSPDVFIEGANDAATAILTDDEEELKLENDEWNSSFSINIKDTATTGNYDVNFVVKGAPGDDGMRETIASLSVTLDVVGEPDAMAGAVASNLVDPGDNVMLRNVALTSMGEEAFATPCRATALGAGDTPDVANSICDWEGKTNSDKAILEGQGRGQVGENGSASIMVDSTAAPGTYTIVLSDGRDDVAAGDRATPKEVTFAVRGRPATYTLDGPVVDGTEVTQIPAGKIGAFTVTATDVNGNTPWFPPDERTQDVSIVVGGPGRTMVTPLRLTEGKVTLNNRGEASFQIRVDEDAPSSSISVDAVGYGQGLASKSVDIGPEALGAPTGLTLATMSDDTGTVTLSWTAGANSTKHWIAGIKQEDWDANDFSNVLWTAPDANTMHTFSGLDGGKVYVFTVAAGNAADQWSDWAPLQRITVGVPAPTGGGGPANPFGGGS